MCISEVSDEDQLGVCGSSLWPEGNGCHDNQQTRHPSRVMDLMPRFSQERSERRYNREFYRR